MSETGTDSIQGGEPWPLKTWHEVLVLLLVPGLLYAMSLPSGLLGYDDQVYYLHNPALVGGSWHGLIEIWKRPFFSGYFPVTQITLWLDLALFGTTNWFGARLHSLLWFVAGVWAVRSWVLRVTGHRGIAFAVALLYAAHPVCASSVAWLAERKNLVCFVFSVWCAERYVASQRAETPSEARLQGCLSFFFGVLALLAKIHAVMLPVWLLLHEIFLGRGSWSKRLFRWVPITAVCCVFVYVSLNFFRKDVGSELLGGSRLAAFLSDGPILVWYMVRTLFPVGLTLFYPVEAMAWNEPFGWSAWVLVAVVIGCLVLLSRRRNLVCFACLTGICLVLPSLNVFIHHPLLMMDHYHHWVLPGWLLAICLFALDLESRFGGRARWSIGLGGCVLIFFCVMTWPRQHEYSSRQAVLEKNTRVQPESKLAWAQYAILLAESDDLVAAGVAGMRVWSCKDAHRLLPGQRARMIELSVSHLRSQGRPEEASALLDREMARLSGRYAPLAEIVRARLAIDGAHPQEAIKLLAPHFKAATHEVAAARLREAKRVHGKAPHEVAPILVLPFPPGDAFDRQRGQEILLKRMLYLAEAHMAAGDRPRALDVVSVLVNMAPNYAPGRALLGTLMADSSGASRKP